MWLLACSAKPSAAVADTLQAPPVEEITIQQLINERPEGVLEFLQDKGVRKLGEFDMQVCAMLSTGQHEQ